MQNKLTRLAIRTGGSGANIYAFTEADDDGDYVFFTEAVAAVEAALSTDAEPVKTAPAVAVKALDVEALIAEVHDAIDQYREGMKGTTFGPNEWPTVGGIKTTVAQALRRSALSAQVQDVSGWQPIETAPTDGTPILGYGEEPCRGGWAHVRETRWQFYGEGSIAKERFKKGEGPSGIWGWREPIHNWGSSWEPTHWMPLPASPASKHGDAE